MIKPKIVFRPLSYLLFFIVQIFPAIAQEEEQIVFGQKVTSPYAWMEDTSSDSLQKWLEKQDSIKFATFKKSDFRKMNGVLDWKGHSSKQHTNQYSFEIFRTTKSPPKLKYKTKNSDDWSETLIRCADFKTHKNDFPSIEDYWVANSELFLVAAISHSGQDWLEFLVYDLQEGKLLSTLKGIIDSHVIFYDKGFYYERFDSPNGMDDIRRNQRLSYHEFDKKQSEDRDIFVNADPTSIRTFNWSQLENSNFLYLFHPVKIKGLWKEAITKIELGKYSELRPFFIYSSPHRITFDPILQKDDSLLMRTDLRDPNFEILKFHTGKINRYRSLVPPSQLILKNVTRLNSNYLGLKYLSEGQYFGVIVDMSGEVKKEIATYEGGGILFQKGSEEEAYCFHTHYTSRYSVETINLNNLQSRRESNPIYYNTEVTNYRSHDGIQIPITIIYNGATFKKNGDQPAMIKVYGGYGIIEEPHFDWENFLFVKNGGVLAFPGVRGSGAKGADWGLAGRGLNKQNTIEDVISAAEYLIKKKFSHPEGLFLQGGSQGGFVVASAGIQRPDLFKGIIANVGVFDLITSANKNVGYHQLNREEYGSPTDSLGFLNRLKLSPIHNLKKGVNYPSFLIITGSNDTRVSPSQSYRFLAALNSKSENPLNFLHLTNGGHNIVQLPMERLKIMSLKFKFLWLHTGYKFWKN